MHTGSCAVCRASQSICDLLNLYPIAMAKGRCPTLLVLVATEILAIEKRKAEETNCKGERAELSRLNAEIMKPLSNKFWSAGLIGNVVTSFLNCVNFWRADQTSNHGKWCSPILKQLSTTSVVTTPRTGFFILLQNTAQLTIHSDYNSVIYARYPAT